MFMMYLFTMFSPTCFGHNCDHLQGYVIIARIQSTNVVSCVAVTLQQLNIIIIFNYYDLIVIIIIIVNCYDKYNFVTIICSCYGVTATQLTTCVPLYSCNNNITLHMAAIAAETCWRENSE